MLHETDSLDTLTSYDTRHSRATARTILLHRAVANMGRTAQTAWQTTVADMERDGFAVVEDALTCAQVERIVKRAREYVIHCQNAVCACFRTIRPHAEAIVRH